MAAIRTPGVESVPLKMMAISAAVVSCSLVVTVVPIQVPILTVFLFAEAHNMDGGLVFPDAYARVVGQHGPYFVLGLVGSLVLAGMFAVLRRQQNPRRDWPFLIPIGFICIATNWIAPLAWSLALVYLNPLMALVFLDREFRQKPPVWRKASRCALLLIPVCLVTRAVFCAWRSGHFPGATR